MLAHESRVYKKLSGGGIAYKLIDIEGIPKLKWFGIEGNYNILIIQLLGPSLQDLLTISHSCFPHSTVVLLAIQMVLCGLIITQFS